MLDGARADESYAYEKWYEGGADILSLWHSRALRHTGRVQAIKEMLGQTAGLR
jgi:hypothetical protein